MHKMNSRNMQARALGAVLRSRQNHLPLAPGVFKSETAGPETPEERKQALVREKIRIMQGLTDIKERMAAADVERQRTGRYAPRRVWLEWTSHRAKLVAELHDIEVELSAAKVLASRAHAVANAKREDKFSLCFMQMAKKMLTQEAYDRIIIATTHRFGDGIDAGDAL